MVHPQNFQLLNVQLQNVQLLNVQLQNVQLRYVQLQGVQITKRPVYQTSRLPNVLITKHKNSLYISRNADAKTQIMAKRKKHRYTLY